MDVLAIIATLAGVAAGVMSVPPWMLKNEWFGPPVVSVPEPPRTVNVFRALLNEVGKELRHAYKLGVAPPLILHGSTLAFRVTTYNYAFHHQIISTAEGDPVLYKAIAFCGFTGMVSDVCTNPYNLTRARMHQLEGMQSDAICKLIRPNTSKRMMKHLVRTYGYGILFTGMLACVPRGSISSSMHLFSYLLVKDFMSEESIMDSSEIERRTTAAVIGAAVSCLCVAPFDLILHKLHNQPLYASGKGLFYKGVVHCFRKTYRLEGIRIFYKEVALLCLKVCPGTAVSLLIWDSLTDGTLQSGIFWEYTPHP